MIGDRLIIEKCHTAAAKKIVEKYLDEIMEVEKFTFAVGGESGAGKSEVAWEIARILKENGAPAGIIQAVDYFIFPARTIQEMRSRNLSQVGESEIKLDFMESNLRSFKNGDADIYKPLSVCEDDMMTTEVMPVDSFRVLIAEGTYCTRLKYIDRRIFIDRAYLDNREMLMRRNRDIMDDLMAKVLEIEHGIVREHKSLADVVISKDFSDIAFIKRKKKSYLGNFAYEIDFSLGRDFVIGKNRNIRAGACQ